MQIQPSEQLKRYNNTVELMKNAKTWRDFHMCQLRFMELADFMDSKELVKQCMEQKQRLDVESKEAIYQDVKERVSKAKSTEDHKAIVQLLTQIRGYKDSDKLLKQELKLATTLKEKLSTTLKKLSDFILNNIGKIAIFLIVLFTIYAISLGLSSSSKGNSSKSEPCGICGGSGTVTHKFLGEGSGIQKGFDTYYRCKGCHGTGRD